MSLLAFSLFSFDSLGCLYRYMTALPMPDCFRVGWSTGGNSRRMERICSRILSAGRQRSGIGASHSVRMFRMLCSMKAICKSCLRSWAMAKGSRAIFFVAGFLFLLHSRSSSYAALICWRRLSIKSSLSLMMSPSLRFFLRRSSFLRAIIISRSETIPRLLESDSLSLAPPPRCSSSCMVVVSFTSSSPDSPKTAFSSPCSSLFPSFLAFSSSLESSTGREMRDFFPPLFFDLSDSLSELSESLFAFIFRLRDDEALPLPTLEPEDETDRDRLFDADRDLERDFDRDPDLERDLDPDLERDLDRDPDLERDLDRDPDLERDLDLDFDFERERDLDPAH